MLFWSLAIAITAACAALYYAGARRAVNAAAPYATAGGADPAEAHYRAQLREIEADRAAGRLPEADAAAAKGDLAREVIRLRGELSRRVLAAGPMHRLAAPAAILLTLAAGLAIYHGIGRPDLPAQPLAGRSLEAPAAMDFEAAIARVEAQMRVTPDDPRGWAVLAPYYMQAGRYDEAVLALRRLIDILGPDAERETDLAEALMMVAGGEATPEALALLESAAARDGEHVRSRFYLAGEATRAGRWEEAAAMWEALIGMAEPGAPWVEVARNGLAAAEAGLAGGEAPGIAEDEAIRGMVEGLAARLDAEGGTAEDWTRLVRSYLVLGETAAAQAAYDAAVAAYPDAGARGDLDALAASGGLVTGEAE